MGDVVRFPTWRRHGIESEPAGTVRPCRRPERPADGYPYALQHLPSGGVALLTPDGNEYRFRRHQAHDIALAMLRMTRPEGSGRP